MSEKSKVEITSRGDRGFHQYGSPVPTAYGHDVEVFESSYESAV